MRYRITIEIDAEKIDRQLLNEAATIGAHNIAKQVELIANDAALVYVTTELVLSDVHHRILFDRT